MDELSLAQKRLMEKLHASPEVVTPTRKAFELLAGATVGHRISKYGVRYGVTPAFRALGDTTGVTAITEYAEPISRGIVGGASAILMFALRGKWSRAITWGALFENLEAGLDMVESAILGAI